MHYLFPAAVVAFVIAQLIAMFVLITRSALLRRKEKRQANRPKLKRSRTSIRPQRPAIT